MKKNKIFDSHKIKEKFNKIYYGKKKIKAIVENPLLYLGDTTPWFKGAQLYVVQKGHKTKVEMVIINDTVNLHVNYTDAVIMTDSEKNEFIRRAVAHMVASRLNKYEDCDYRSVVWACLTSQNLIPEDWICPKKNIN